MQIKDDISPAHGVLEVRVRRRGQIIDHWEDENLIVAGARTMLARLLAGDGTGLAVTRIGFGTNGTAPTPNDTSLTSAYVRNLTGFDYPAPGQVRFHFALAGSEANGKAIREFGLIAVDGSLFSRKTRGVIEKHEDISLDGMWTITF